MNKLLAIVGPTATGKTAAALTLAKQFNGELISCDSRQVYRGMDIATGKDLPEKIPMEALTISVPYHEESYSLTPYDLSGVPIWLYDVVNPDQSFSVSQYEVLVRTVINDIHARGKLPILVGGTGFYYQAVLYGFESSEVPPDPQLRRELEDLSLPALQLRLQQESIGDWEEMNQSDQNNPRRLVRRLELIHQGFTFMKKSTPKYDALTFGLTMPIDILEKRIRDRVLKRVKEGSIEELQKLISLGYANTLPSMQTMGYSEWQFYLEHPSEDVKQKTIAMWITHERQYAKRQMTWFKKDASIQWVEAQSPETEKYMNDQVSLWYTKR